MTAEQARFDLSVLSEHELAELGARVRRCAAGRAATCDEVAGAIVDTLWDAFEDRTPPVLALVRLYRVRRARDLPPAQCARAPGADDDARLLVLAATRGLEPAWNDPARSEAHAVVPLDDPAAAAQVPLLARLVADTEAAAAREPAAVADAFFVPEAVGSPLLPVQRGFVLRYGVRAALGCAGALPDGSRFALVMFSRVAIAPEMVTGFPAIGLHAQLALGRATDLGAPPGVIAAARACAAERLLELQEAELVGRAASLTREAEAARRRADELERALAREAAGAAQRTARTQRAMLNVIEDLREARSDLERRVAQRTIDLERTNADLLASNAELEQFAYVASHDLQEPLRTIAGYVQLLGERYGDRLDADGHEFIAYAAAGAHRMQELIDALLAYSRISRGPLELGVVPLDLALDDALAGMARSFAESGASLVRDPLPEVRGDPILLRQLFQNLLSNAIKFCGARPPEIEIRTEHHAREVALAVRDRGIGFDPKYAEQVFKMFRRLQRKLPGTGIGLAICKKIVERHGGTIHAVSAPSQGATFHVTLPAIEAPP